MNEPIAFDTPRAYAPWLPRLHGSGVPGSAPFVCMDCGATCPVAGDCIQCGQGPLLDGRDPDVQNACRAIDDRARERLAYRRFATATAPMATTSVLIAILPMRADVPLWLLLLGAIGSTVAARIARRFVFVPRFPYLAA